MPALAGVPPVLFPLHVVLLELIIDPTCSIVFEAEPAHPDLMRRPPRPARQPIIGLREFASAAIHGLAMFAPLLAIDLLTRRAGVPAQQVAALDFTVLVAGNVALMATYRSGKSLLHAAMGPGRPFRIAIVAIGVFVLLATRVRDVAGWLDFEPPPLGWWGVAVALPFAVASILRRWTLRG